MQSHANRNGQTRPNKRSKGYVGIRPGQGPDSSKKWIRDLYVNFGRKKLGKKQDTDSLFANENQAKRTLRRARRLEAMLPPAQVTGKGINRHQNIPSHLYLRAQAAKLYLAERGIDFSQI